MRPWLGFGLTLRGSLPTQEKLTRGNGIYNEEYLITTSWVNPKKPASP